VSAAVTSGRNIEPRPQRLRARGRIGQTLQQRAQVKSRPNREDGQPSALAQIAEQFKRPPPVFPRGENFLGADEIHHVMGNAAALFNGRLGRSNVKTAIDLGGIAGDYFAGKSLRKEHRQGRFPGRRRSKNGE